MNMDDTVTPDWLVERTNCIKDLKNFESELEDNSAYVEMAIRKDIKSYLEKKEFNADKLGLEIDYVLDYLVGIEKPLTIFEKIEDIEECFGYSFTVFTEQFRKNCVKSEDGYLEFIANFLNNEDVKENISNAITEYFSENVGVDFDIVLYRVVTKKDPNNDINFNFYIKCYITSVYYFIVNELDEYIEEKNKLPLSILDLFETAVKILAIHDAIIISEEMNNYKNYVIEYSNWVNMSFYINQTEYLGDIQYILLDALEDNDVKEIVDYNIEGIRYIEEDVHRFLSDGRTFDKVLKMIYEDEKQNKIMDKLYIRTFLDVINYAKVGANVTIRKDGITLYEKE